MLTLGNGKKREYRYSITMRSADVIVYIPKRNVKRVVLRMFKVVDSFSDPHSTQNTTKVYSFEYVGQ